MRYYLLRLLFSKNREDAINNGINPTLIVIISYVLLAGMWFIGYMIGLYIWGGYIAYICAIVFAALGYYISHVIANHSFVDYTPRKKNLIQVESYVSKKYFMPWTHVERMYAQITVVTESGGCAPSAAWEFFLNGRRAGEVKDGSPITFPTGHKSNVIVARNDKGALSPPFEFSVKSGRHLELRFSDGRFEGANYIGRLALNRPGRSSRSRHAAR
jgi:hypothetical protein